jgi:hypothetical protein
MRKTNLFGIVAAFAASAAMVVPSAAVMADAPRAAQVATATDNVVLGAGGTLQGSALTSEGKALSGAVVTVSHNGQVVAQTVSTQDGAFSVNGLRGGLHTVSAGGSAKTYRLWTADAAPEAAQTRVTVVESAVRGQCADECAPGCDSACGGGGCFGGAGGFATVAAVGALALGAAALVVAIDANNDNDGS